MQYCWYNLHARGRQQFLRSLTCVSLVKDRQVSVNLLFYINIIDGSCWKGVFIDDKNQRISRGTDSYNFHQKSTVFSMVMIIMQKMFHL